eukprot:scaffold38038_cov45-Cyclotella_meneghiniana.AAC.1
MTEWPERRARGCGGAKHSAVSAQKPHSTTSVTMADPPSHPPQTPHDATNRNPSLTPIKQHPLRSVYQASLSTVNDEISANTRPKRKAAVAAQRGWTVTPSPLTIDATGNSPTTSEGDADSNKRQGASADDDSATDCGGDPTNMNHLYPLKT